MGGAGHWVCRVVRRGLWIGGMVDELGETSRVRAVCGVPHGRGNRGCVLGIEDGGIGTSDSGIALLALIPNTQFEIICNRGTSVWYHRSVREFLQAGLRQRQHPPRHSAFPKKLRRDSCAY